MTRFETRSPDWLSVGEALDRILGRAVPLETEGVPLAKSLGRALASGVSARATLPPWDNSAMDGYAIRHVDVLHASTSSPILLRVVGDVRAGGSTGTSVGPGEAVRIMTGAPVPPGADAIVRVEDTDSESTPGEIRISVSPGRGKDIRPRGQDMTEGEDVLAAGTTVGSGQIGLLAASGTETVAVHRRPRVAILSNGDEIVPASDFNRVVAGEAIPETNRPTLSAAVEGAGGVAVSLGIAEDTRESILQKVALARSEKVDALLTSGGASMGEFDLFKRVLDEEGLQLDFWRVRMRPGTPFSFGFLPAISQEPALPVFGLPGNPASSFVTFQILCRPFLLRLAGHGRIHRPVVMARAGDTFDSPSHLTHFFRVSLSDDALPPVARLTGSQTSGLVRGQGLAHGLAVVPEGTKQIREGDDIRVVLLDDFGIGGGAPGYLP